MTEIVRLTAEDRVGELRSSSRNSEFAGWRIEYARDAIRQAATAGIDVTDLEAEMPELERIVLRGDADRQVFMMREYAQRGRDDRTWQIAVAKTALQRATAAGIDVSDLEAEMPELEKKIRGE